MSIEIAFWVIVLICAIAVLQRPGRGIAAALCLYGLKQWAMASSPYFALNRTIPNFAMAGVATLGACLLFARHRANLRWPKPGWLVMALFVFAFASGLWTIAPEWFTEQWNLTAPYLGLLLLICPLLASSTDDVYDGLVGTIWLGALLTVLLLFTVSWKGRGVTFQIDHWRLVGVKNASTFLTGNPLAAAEMAAYVMLSCVLLNFKRLDGLAKVLRWFIAGIALVLIVLSASRGQFFGSLIALIVFIPVSRPVRNLAQFGGVAAATLLVIAIGYWALSTFAAPGNRWSTEAMTGDMYGTRFLTSMAVLRAWFNAGPLRWIVGLGSCGSFSPSVNGWYPEVHMAEAFGELGLIGGTLWCWIIFTGLRTIVRTYRKVKDFALLRGQLATLGSMFCFELILSFKQGSIIGGLNLYMFAIILGRFELAVDRETQPVISEMPEEWSEMTAEPAFDSV